MNIAHIAPDSNVSWDAADVGRADYERDLAKRPTYHDGTPRPAWERLSSLAKWSWSRPTKLDETEGKKP